MGQLIPASLSSLWNSLMKNGCKNGNKTCTDEHSTLSCNLAECWCNNFLNRSIKKANFPLYSLCQHLSWRYVLKEWNVRYSTTPWYLKYRRKALLICDKSRCYGCQSKLIVQVMSSRSTHHSAQCLLFGSHTAVSACLQEHMELKGHPFNWS